MSAIAKPKLKRCKQCHGYFHPRNTLDRVCSVKCAIAYNKAYPETIAKIGRQLSRLETREDRERIKPLKAYEKEAQRAVNAYVRERDKFDGCISCDMPENYGGQWHASHYRSTGAAPQLRFNLDNLHKGCAQCNTHKSGNVVEYRIKLVRKIGVERVEALENDNAIVRRTKEELIAIRRDLELMRKTLVAKRSLGAMCA